MYGTGTGAVLVYYLSNGNLLFTIDSSGTDYSREISELPAGYFSSLNTVLLEWTDLNTVTLHWSGGSLSLNNSASSVSNWSVAHIGAWFGSSAGTTITFAELFAGTGALDSTKRAALLSTSQRVEEIAGLTAAWGWTLDVAGTAGVDAGATLPAIVGTVPLTNSGMVIAADAHPVTRSAPASLSGGVTLDPAVAAGTLTVATADMAGGVTLDNAAAGGSGLGMQSGIVTALALRNWSGSLQTSVTIPVVTVCRLSDGAQVLTLTNQVTHASTGDLTITSASLLVGAWYMVMGWNADGSARFAVPLQATA